jgi:hypothetical protein
LLVLLEYNVCARHLPPAPSEVRYAHRPLPYLYRAGGFFRRARFACSPLMLGIVTQAKDAILCTGPVSAGTTAYDGDLLSTDAEGALTVRGLGPG